jgi:hypothetical protein
MKSFVLMLVAALGIAAGTAAMSSPANADVHLYPPSQNNGQG